MLKIQCPECDKGEKSELQDVLPERRYRLRCSDCGATYVLAGAPTKEQTCGHGENQQWRLRNF